MNIKLIIERACDVLYKHQEDDCNLIYDLLISEGWDEITCSKAVAFIPIAFCRLLLIDSGVSFSENYICIKSDSKEREEKSFFSEPFFCKACDIAKNTSKTHNSDYFLAIAGRSAEFRTINQLLNNGSSLENIKLTSPMIFL